MLILKGLELSLFGFLLILSLQASGTIKTEIIPKKIVNNILFYFQNNKIDDNV